MSPAASAAPTAGSRTTRSDERAPVRRRLPSAQRRAGILAAARTLFARHGYEATTTRMIATEAGVTDALIYRHFASKAELLTALVDQMTAEFAAMTEPGDRADLVHRADPAAAADHPSVPADGSARSLLAGLGGAFAAAFDAHLDLLLLLLANRELLADDHRLAAFIHHAATGLGRRLRPEDPDRGYLLARGFMAAIAGFGLLQHTLGLDELAEVDVGDYVGVLADAFGGAAEQPDASPTSVPRLSEPPVRLHDHDRES